MEFVGKTLKESREEKNISINEVAENLKISILILKKIENDDFSNDFNKVYMTGHVRSYANFLNLDSNNLVQNFKNQTSFDKNTTNVDLPKPLELNNFFNFSKSISVFSFTFICIGFYFFFIYSNDLNPDYAMTPDLSPELEAEIEEIILNNDLNNNKKNITPSNELKNQFASLDNLFISEETQESSISQIDVNASIPLDEEINIGVNNDRITLKFVDSSWIQIRDSDDKIIFSKLMNIDEEYSYFINDNYYITTGNAGNVLVLVNGETKGKVGKKGEVIESLFINSDFNN